MGMFSWNCKACGHPALCENATDKGINEWMHNVVVLGNKGMVEGCYDGYGRVDGETIYALGLFDPCLYHKACWVEAGRPGYDGKPSQNAKDQGWFFETGAHDMLEPGIDHPPGTLEKAQALREARLLAQRNAKALSMYERGQSLTEQGNLWSCWTARWSVHPRHGGEGFMLCDDLDGDWHEHDTYEEAEAHAQKLWTNFVTVEIPEIQKSP